MLNMLVFMLSLRVLLSLVFLNHNQYVSGLRGNIGVQVPIPTGAIPTSVLPKSARTTNVMPGFYHSAAALPFFLCRIAVPVSPSPLSLQTEFDANQFPLPLAVCYRRL